MSVETSNIENIKFKKVLITGGAGYVGSALVPSLLEKGVEVVVYDLYMYGDVFKNFKQNKKLTEINADIRDKQKLIAASKGCDAMIHLACISNDPSFELNPDLGKSINYDAFFNILAACKDNKIKRLIYASSSSVYGIKEEKDVKEDAKLEPLTDYSKFKMECEKELEKADLSDTNWVIVRPATVCGYAPRLRLDLSVNILTTHAYFNKLIKIFGGSQLRPNINIRDMVRVYELFLSVDKEKIHGKAFNAGFQNMAIQVIGDLVKKVYNNPEVQCKITPTDDLRSYHINSDKIQNELGFEMKFTVEDAIQSLVEAFEMGLVEDPFNNPMYYNIKRMQELKLK